MRIYDCPRKLIRAEARGRGAHIKLRAAEVNCIRTEAHSRLQPLPIARRRQNLYGLQAVIPLFNAARYSPSLGMAMPCTPSIPAASILAACSSAVVA